MQTYRIMIERVSPGTQVISHECGITPGNGNFALTPAGPVEVVTQLTQVQIVGLQGYLSCILAGATTTSIETAITAVGPT